MTTAYTDAPMTGTVSAASPPEREARIAGVAYLLVIASGIFSALFVRETLFVPGNAAATTRAIADNEALWRSGIAVHLLYLFAGATTNVILYRIFRRVHETLALLALAFALADVVIEALLLTFLYVPLMTLEESGVFSALTGPQRDAMGYLAIRFFLRGWSFALVLFSGFCALTGSLILRSRFVPRLIGALMIAAGAGYFVSGLMGILSPAFAQSLVPWILLLPSFVGELSLALWLTIKGVDARAPEVA